MVNLDTRNKNVGTLSVNRKAIRKGMAIGEEETAMAVAENSKENVTTVERRATRKKIVGICTANPENRQTMQEKPMKWHSQL